MENGRTCQEHGVVKIVKRIKLGIVGASDIAKRRFIPALLKFDEIELTAIASRDRRKAEDLCTEFVGQPLEGYESITDGSLVDAVYICLPPALHFEWASRAIKSGKHVLVEKPVTDNLEQTLRLTELAREHGVALHENYTNLYHCQLSEYTKLLSNGLVGEVNSFLIRFGFPHRASDDFRYNKALGGGALLDCGGYCVSLAHKLLGENCYVVGSTFCKPKNDDVDVQGSAILTNGSTYALLSFGMDNEYVCEIEAWGSKGRLLAPRIFTAPPNLSPTFTLVEGGKVSSIPAHSDNQFLNSINAFYKSIIDIDIRKEEFARIETQSRLVDAIKCMF